MTDRYDPPERGEEDWDVPLNKIFADLNIEVLDEVNTTDDLPATGDKSSSGIPRRIYVREERTIYRDDGDWVPIAGVGATAADLIGSPNLHIPYSEAADGAVIRQPVSVGANETLTVYAWGAYDTEGQTPAGLTVELRSPDGEIVESASTNWQADENGITAWKNTTDGRVNAVLAIKNATGSDYTDPDGVGGQFGYEVN